MSVLSVQSRVIQGHVGNSAAVLPLQLMEREVWAVDTVCFSNHPGRGRFRGRVVPPSEVSELLLGLEEQAIFPRCRAIVSGYLGDAGNSTAIARAVLAVKAANPKALYLLDPVMGDNDTGNGGGLYVRPAVPDAIRQDLLPLADLLTPNQFELEHLTGRPTGNTGDAIAAARSLNISRVVVTSLRATDTPENCVDTLMVTAQAVWRVRQHDLKRRFDGAGDLFAALLLGNLLEDDNSPRALSLACGSLAVVLTETSARNLADMPLTVSLPAALQADGAPVEKVIL
jgi:pyridoxine kinase